MTSPEEDRLTACLKYAATRMLSVGSGDGSQQLAIVQAGHPNLCVSFYDSEKDLLRKYPHAGTILDELKETCKYPPVFNIDATKLDQYKQALNGAPFDLIFFTFPHTGVSNNPPTSIESNQKLLRGFLSTAHHLLTPQGQIQLTLKSGEHYSKWNLQSIIKQVTDLQYEGSGSLRKNLFPGYKHRLTNGMGGKLKEVPDKRGATVYRFRHSSSQPKSQTNSSHLTSIDIFAMDTSETETKKRKDIEEAPQGSSCKNDEWIRQRILDYLPNSKPKNPTVLEIRRGAFREGPPPVPQLNRVLYKLNEEKVLRMLPCEGPSKKPRWSLVP